MGETYYPESIQCCTTSVESIFIQGYALDVIVVQGNSPELRSISEVCVNFNQSGLVKMLLNGKYIADMICRSKDKPCYFLLGDSLKPNANILNQMPLEERVNEIQFQLFSNEGSKPIAVARSTLHYWNSTDKVVVVDVDGTIVSV